MKPRFKGLFCFGHVDTRDISLADIADHVRSHAAEVRAASAKATGKFAARAIVDVAFWKHGRGIHNSDIEVYFVGDEPVLSQCSLIKLKALIRARNATLN